MNSITAKAPSTIFPLAPVTMNVPPTPVRGALPTRLQRPNPRPILHGTSYTIHAGAQKTTFLDRRSSGTPKAYNSKYLRGSAGFSSGELRDNCQIEHKNYEYPAPYTSALPASLRSQLEMRSGVPLVSVRVHHNSPNPIALSALAYTMGNDIYVAPGQDKHIPHEAWHVIQQNEGRVHPTSHASGTRVNEDFTLEREADELKYADPCVAHQRPLLSGARPPNSRVIQKKIGLEFEMHIFPVDKLRDPPKEIAALDDQRLYQEGIVADKTVIANNDDYTLTVDNTTEEQMLAGPWNTGYILFPRAAANSILEIVMKPAENQEKLQSKIRACTDLADRLYRDTANLTKRIPYGGFHIGPINNELGSLDRSDKLSILHATKKYDALAGAGYSEEHMLNHDGWNMLGAERTKLSTNASIQVNLGVSMRHFAKFAEWYGKEVIYRGRPIPTARDPMPYAALYFAPQVGREVYLRLIEKMHSDLRGSSQRPVVIVRRPGIEGMLTLLAMYIMGGFEDVNASEQGIGTEKNFTKILSKTGLNDAFQHRLAPHERSAWIRYENFIKDELLQCVNQQLTTLRGSSVNIRSSDRMINWFWTSTEDPTDRSNPELWSAAEGRSYVNITIDQVFQDIQSNKDRLLMRLYHIPTTEMTTYRGLGPIPMDVDPDTNFALNVVEFRGLPGFHPVDKWLSIAQDFFAKAQAIHYSLP